MNHFYPISLNLSKKLCLVIGGGPVALRRLSKLLEAGALVKVISPRIQAELKVLLEAHESSSWVKAHYTGPQDLKGAHLVFAATNDSSLNKAICKDANSLGILANIASQGQLGDFIIPATFNQGDLQVTVSTSGKVPGLSKAIKEDLQETLSPGYATLIKILEEIRDLAITNSCHKDQNLEILSEITKNYLSILDQLDTGISTHTIGKELLSLLK